MVATISPKQLAELRQSGANVELIDVRTPVEFREVHVDFARNVPLDQLAPTALGAPSGRPLYVICRSGSRGKQACEKLAAAGLDVVNVDGGTQAWDQAGLPVVRGQKMMSLERQVRIAAGLMVVISTLLSRFAHPYWIGLAAFVGSGLVFAGVTDTCGMGMLLAKMPWNRVTPTAASSTTSTSKSCETKGSSSCCG